MLLAALKIFVNNIGKFFGSLRADEQRPALLEFELYTPVAAYIIGISFPAETDAPTAIFPYGPVSSGSAGCNAVKSNFPAREWKKTNVNTVGANFSDQF